MNSEKLRKARAAEFAQRWAGRGYERGESQLFWTDLLQNVFGVEEPASFIRFEEKVKVDATNFIDGHILSTHVIIEQKSIDKDLRAAIRQSDGLLLNPFQQAKRYVANLPLSQHPKWIVTCNFREFLVYDMEQPNGEPESILLERLADDIHRLAFLVDTKSERIKKEEQVSKKASEKVARIYDALLRQYDDSSPEALRWLNILCVRLVFCLYAEDGGFFGRDQFYHYLSAFDAQGIRQALLDLFQTLNTPVEHRSRYMRPDLKAFPYTNGGLFAEEIEIPPFTEEARTMLLEEASLKFDWSDINPTIFGALFESTLNPETRRTGGMHYTSVENIHRVIDPLFLNDLRAEFERIKEEPVERKRNRRLDDFQSHLASLTFFDPACGSGNFLTETYLSLRRLENDVISERYHGQTFVDFEETNPVRVSIQQFYGIELNDFAVVVATAALWISEAQMLSETERIIRRDIDFLPLRHYANIVEGNALRLDWSTIIPPDRLSFIIGNPPFVGARMMSEAQKSDVLGVFGKGWKNVGNIDYVGCWYKRAWELIRNTHARAALVSTNSICQGEQVANLWQPLMQEGLTINFAWRTFRWDNDADDMAHVHCVIVGFSNAAAAKAPFTIFDNERAIAAHNINAYLLDAPSVFAGSRSKPLCDVPEIGIGNQPIDGGNYLFSKEEMEAFVAAEPQSRPYFHQWYGAQEFINQNPRYCLWLGDCSPSELRRMPLCLKRVQAVRELRLASTRTSTRKLADRPTRFQVENMPEGDSILVPRVSSERRRYIPMGYIGKGIFCSDAVHLIPSATLYHFGVLTSNVHMAWMRAVCGRLEMRYRYSKDIVYNNFPWPAPSEEQRKRIEQTAQHILDARAQFPDASLADLYDETTMPPALRRAHQANDRAVMEAYGFPVSNEFTESRCVARLFELYNNLTQ